MAIDLSRGTSNHALFLPAINQGFARFPLKPSNRPLPGGFKPSDLNYLDWKSPLFHYHASLHSAAFGVYDNEPTIITQRDRDRTISIGDSGGFNEINNNLREPVETFMVKSFEWVQRHSDVGITFDVPTRAIGINPKYNSQQDCVDVTLESLRHAKKHRWNHDIVICTVMQGVTPNDAYAWQAAIAPHQPFFEGIALAGAQKLNLALWCELLVEMHKASQLDRLRWIHVLGTAQPGVGVMLTGLQRALRKHWNPNLRISYDASLAFRIAQVNKQITQGISYEPNGKIAFQRYQFPNHWSALDRDADFPFESPIGDLSKFRDFNPGNAGSATGWDSVGAQMLSHHEVYNEVRFIREANKLAVAEIGDHFGALPAGQGKMPWDIRKAWEGFDKIFAPGAKVASLIKIYGPFLNSYGPDALEDDER